MTFDPALMDYTQQYENSLHFSPRFQSYVEDLADQLIARYHLQGKTIIDIGCGKGEFLTLICERANARGFGFDRSYMPENNKSANKERVTFIQDFYSERYSNYQADFIACRHVLEHIQHPVAFLRDVRRAVGDARNSVIFFEVPNVRWTLRDMAVWDIIYEHCAYFSAASLDYLFGLAGFAPQRIREEFGGQYLTIEALPVDESVAAVAEEWDVRSQMAQDANLFAMNYQEKVREWQRAFGDLARSGERAVVWGAGSKGVSLLNTMRDVSGIEFVVDINPRKHGMHIAGTGQRIVPPEFLREYQPDVVILMNPMYQSEIQQLLGALGVYPRMISA
jgi:SAM-dependent methyltransferase